MPGRPSGPAPEISVQEAAALDAGRRRAVSPSGVVSKDNPALWTPHGRPAI